MAKFKVGDKIRAIDNAYKSSKLSNETEGTVTSIKPNGRFDFRVTHSTLNRELGRLKENMKPEHFALIKDVDNLYDLDRYIINENATILFWSDGTKTMVKRRPEDTFNKQLAFLTAYFQKKCGMTRNRANKFLDGLEVNYQLKDTPNKKGKK